MFHTCGDEYERARRTNEFLILNENVVLALNNVKSLCAARRLIEQIESDWEQRIGSELMAALWKALEAINRPRPSEKAPES